LHPDKTAASASANPVTRGFQHIHLPHGTDLAGPRADERLATKMSSVSRKGSKGAIRKAKGYIGTPAEGAQEIFAGFAVRAEQRNEEEREKRRENLPVNGGRRENGENAISGLFRLRPGLSRLGCHANIGKAQHSFHSRPFADIVALARMTPELQRVADDDGGNGPDPVGKEEERDADEDQRDADHVNPEVKWVAMALAPVTNEPAKGTPATRW
jgi:hypothetical protein